MKPETSNKKARPCGRARRRERDLNPRWAQCPQRISSASRSARLRHPSMQVGSILILGVQANICALRACLPTNTPNRL
ncbi:hypothetical protein ARMA_0524 [Ardenticatena maritima]|uniref:Uncharacterized protein n=1 Tax=Ardenticatena maritima TaxID=872965 RepID=A0A0N0RFH0_9CHLR|nr:hypothetical protein ARMA_0524 [Ardenticatena maritima]